MAVENTVPTPERCPYCASKTIVSAARKPTAANYWRCEACGELWHPERLQTNRLSSRRYS